MIKNPHYQEGHRLGKMVKKGKSLLRESKQYVSLKELECPTGRKANYDLFKEYRHWTLTLGWTFLYKEKQARSQI